MVNFLCCTAQYYLLATCDSIERLWLSKLPGVGMAGFLVAQMAVLRPPIATASFSLPSPQKPHRKRFEYYVLTSRFGVEGWFFCTERSFYGAASRDERFCEVSRLAPAGEARVIALVQTLECTKSQICERF